MIGQLGDVWKANGQFGYSYNKLYDLFYKAGVPVNQMRVASPFNEWAMQSLNIYRVIEPKAWAKLVGRVEALILLLFMAIQGLWAIEM